MSKKLGHVLEREIAFMPLNVFIPVNAASLCSFLPKELICCQHACVLARCYCIPFGGHQEISNFKIWSVGWEGQQTLYSSPEKKPYETHFHS